jgi:peptidoglycan/LPS O-acetylase OafA/YrhL
LTAVSTPVAAPPSARLDYLEGLRGLAALYVVLHHVYMALHYRHGPPGIGAEVPAAFFKAMKFLDFGHYAVDVFIVLSGYCLMLPIVSSADGVLRGGVSGYLRRRARRILPPYYAVLVVSLVAVPVMRMAEARIGIADSLVQSGFTPAIVIAHLLLVHNVVPQFSLFTNPPLWSVATEWQIYFFFPPLLGLWRRLGVPALLAGSFVVGLAPHFLLRGLFDSAYPWYLGLFALGMAGAYVGFSARPDALALRERVDWGMAARVLWVGLAVFGVIKSGWYADHRWAADPLFGLATMCLLVYCTSQLRSGAGPSRFSVVRLLDAHAVRRLGAFSYSLYLIHFPLLSLADTLLLALRVTGVVRAAALFGLAVPAIVLAAYVFYLGFEKPFLSARAARRAQASLG